MSKRWTAQRIAWLTAANADLDAAAARAFRLVFFMRWPRAYVPRAEFYYEDGGVTATWADHGDTNTVEFPQSYLWADAEEIDAEERARREVLERRAAAVEQDRLQRLEDNERATLARLKAKYEADGGPQPS